MSAHHIAAIIEDLTRGYLDGDHILDIASAIHEAGYRKVPSVEEAIAGIQFEGADDSHIGRSFAGHPLEDDCPCPKAACGLVPSNDAVAECEHHPATRSKTMRQQHLASRCPARAAGAA